MNETSLNYQLDYQTTPPLSTYYMFLPVMLFQPEALSVHFSALIDCAAYFIACVSVTVSLLICMAIILFSCVCLLELVIQSVNEAMDFVKVSGDIGNF